MVGYGPDDFVSSASCLPYFEQLIQLTALIANEQTLRHVTRHHKIESLTLCISSRFSDNALLNLRNLSQLQSLELNMQFLPTLQSIGNILSNSSVFTGRLMKHGKHNSSRAGRKRQVCSTPSTWNTVYFGAGGAAPDRCYTCVVEGHCWRVVSVI